MEASSQIQNLLCLSLLHLCSSFFHYLTLNQVAEVGTTDRNGGNYLIAVIHRGQKFKETMEAFQQKRAEFIAQEIRNFDAEKLRKSLNSHRQYRSTISLKRNETS